MIPAFFRLLLFLSSYFPAFAVVAILYWDRQRAVAAGALALGVLGIGALLLVVHHYRTQIHPTTVSVLECRRNDSEALTYVLSYLIPFVGGALKGRQEAIAYGVFFLVIGILYANSNMVHINPMLNLFGFRLYEAKLSSKDTVVLISRRRIVAGDSLKVAALADEIYLESTL